MSSTLQISPCTAAVEAQKDTNRSGTSGVSPRSSHTTRLHPHPLPEIAMDLTFFAPLIYICIMIGGCLAALSILTRQQRRPVRVTASGKVARQARDS